MGAESGEYTEGQLELYGGSGAKKVMTCGQADVSAPLYRLRLGNPVRPSAGLSVSGGLKCHQWSTTPSILRYSSYIALEAHMTLASHNLMSMLTHNIHVLVAPHTVGIVSKPI